MIKDQAIAWNVRREFIPCAHMTGLLEATNLITSLGAGTPVFQEPVAAAQLAGLQIAAAGDEIFHLWKLPWDLDRDLPLAARLLFSHASTDTDNPDWLVSLKGLAAGEALTAATATPDATLTFAAKAVAAVADALEVTNWMKTTTGPFSATDLYAMMAIECNGLGSASANEITLFGIELAYTIKATGDSQQRDKTNVALSGLY